MAEKDTEPENVLEKNATFQAFALSALARAKDLGYDIANAPEGEVESSLVEAAKALEPRFVISNQKKAAIVRVTAEVLKYDAGWSHMEQMLKALKCEESFIKEAYPLMGGNTDEIDTLIRLTFPDFEEKAREVDKGPLPTHDTIPTLVVVAEREFRFDLNEVLPILSQFVVSREEELVGFLRLGLFQGFDRITIIQRSLEALSFQAIFVIAALTALRGPSKMMSDEAIVAIQVSKADGSLATIGQLFTTKVLLPEKSKVGKLKRGDLTAGRISAAFADLAVYGLLLLDERSLISKRIESNPLPSWMQCTQAASLPMSVEWRNHHSAFAEGFSKLIKGTFSPSIYSQQSSNVFLPSGPVRNELIRASGGSILEDAAKNAVYSAPEKAEAKAEERTGATERKG